MIWTSYWSKTVPEGMVQVAISRGTPRGWKGLRYDPLTPSSWGMLKLPPDEFREAYQAQLDALDPARVYAEVLALAAPLVPVLVCWEKDRAACHRSMAAALLAQAGEVRELE